MPCEPERYCLLLASFTRVLVRNSRPFSRDGGQLIRRRTRPMSFRALERIFRFRLVGVRRMRVVAAGHFELAAISLHARDRQALVGFLRRRRAILT